MQQRFSRRSFFLSLAAFTLIAIFSRATRAAPIHVFGNTSQYGTIDSETGVYSSLGRLTDSFTNASIPLSGFAFGADGNLYGVTGIDGPGENGEGNYLWRFNPANGVSTDRRDLPVSLVTLASRPSDGRLFGYSNDAEGNGSLFGFDLVTFAPSLIGATGVVTFGALTFDDANRLYLAHSFTGDIYRVNADSGATTLFSATGILGISGMAAIGDTLYTFSTDARERHAVNLQTGAVSLLGTYGIGGNSGDDLIYGAAISPPPPSPAVVPEPATGILFALASVVGTALVVKRLRTLKRSGVSLRL